MTARQWLSFRRFVAFALSLFTSRALVAAIPLLVLLLVASVAWGQATTSVRGSVTNPGGNAIIGANVVLANAESKNERVEVTGDQGEYQFLFIPPGTYTLKVKAAGFGNYEQKGLTLLVYTPATANVQLRVAGPRNSSPSRWKFQQTISWTLPSAILSTNGKCVRFRSRAEMSPIC